MFYIELKVLKHIDVKRERSHQNSFTFKYVLLLGSSILKTYRKLPTVTKQLLKWNVVLLIFKSTKMKTNSIVFHTLVYFTNGSFWVGSYTGILYKDNQDGFYSDIQINDQYPNPVGLAPPLCRSCPTCGAKPDRSYLFLKWKFLNEILLLPLNVD